MPFPDVETGRSPTHDTSTSDTARTRPLLGGLIAERKSSINDRADVFF